MIQKKKRKDKNNAWEHIGSERFFFNIPKLIQFLSASTRLLPGTVILTGTPQGVGAARKPPIFLKPGDDVTISIERIGDLRNPVVAEVQ